MNQLKSLLKTALVLGALAQSAVAADLINRAGESHVALNGYDPVAFFTESKPVHGDPGITETHQGATYFFASRANRRSFTAAPDKYAPQYGGYCAFGVSVGALFPVDVSTWEIIDDRLYVVLNPSVKQAFDKDRSGTIAKAEKNWPKLVGKHAK